MKDCRDAPCQLPIAYCQIGIELSRKTIRHLSMRFNTINTILIIAIGVLLSSCGSTYEFPKSIVAPAAKIEVKAEQDSYDNNVFTLKVEHLTSPERLNPPKSVYVVWAETDGHGVINMGNLTTEADDKAELRTSTPFPVTELFITAENEALVRVPAGIEIARVEIE
jgi:hypothetical protein